MITTLSLLEANVDGRFIQTLISQTLSKRSSAPWNAGVIVLKVIKLRSDHWHRVKLISDHSQGVTVIRDHSCGVGVISDQNMERK